MAAAPRLEAAAPHGQRAVIADVERMGAAARPFAGAEPGEGALFDQQRGGGIVGGEDALLAVAEPRLADREIARLEPDARAVAVGHADVGESQAVHPRAAPAQHQRRLAFAGRAVEHRLARDLRHEGYRAGGLHRAVAIAARCHADGARAIPDRVDRLLEPAEAASGLDQRVGGGAGLRGEHGESQHGERGAAEAAGHLRQSPIEPGRSVSEQRLMAA